MIDRLFVESVAAALRSLRSSPSRSILTSLGVAVGVAATITVVSIIGGFSSQITDRFKGFGTNSITIQPRNSFEDQMKGRVAYLRYEELDHIARRIGGISNITPEMSVFGQFRGSASYRGRSITTDVKGTTSTWQDLTQVYPSEGRFLVDSDDTSRRRVAVVGKTVVSQLKLAPDPVGEYILLGSAWVKVVGVLQERGKSFGMDQDDLILIPFATGRAITNRERDPSFWIQFEVDDPARVEATVERVQQVLREVRGIEEDQEDDFDVLTATQFMEAFNEMTLSVSLISVGIMAISMVVGGIGIMNILLVSVAERTREIGVLKALGATRGWIIVTFVSEAVLMAGVGCVLGLVLSAFALMGIAMVPGFPTPSTPLWAVLMSIGFCLVIGTVFGVVPAVRAANMEPADAMRH